MISRFEERYYNDINSLASTMPRVVELLEKLVDNAKPVEPEPIVPSDELTRKHNEKPEKKHYQFSQSGSSAAVTDVQERCNCRKELGMPDYWVCDICDIAKRNNSLNSVGVLMHTRPINWNPDDEELDLTVVYKVADGKLVVNPICPRCNYRYTACSDNGKDWYCENCCYEWQTHNNLHGTDNNSDQIIKNYCKMYHTVMRLDHGGVTHPTSDLRRANDEIVNINTQEWKLHSRKDTNEIS